MSECVSPMTCFCARLKVAALHRVTQQYDQQFLPKSCRLECGFSRQKL